jgi:predicted transcriptional regulator
VNIQPLLKDIGLTDNEVTLYVTLLSLSPTTVQILARKAGIPRATAYLVLDSLTRHELITKYRDGRKTLIAAKPPQYLFHFIERQESTLQHKRVGIERAVPFLQAIMQSNEERLFVRPLNGTGALRTLQQEMLMRSSAGDTWYALMPLDQAGEVLGEKQFLHAPRIAKRIKLKLAFTTQSPELKEKILAQSNAAAEYIPLTPSQYQSPIGFLISRDQTTFLNFAKTPSGLVIENQSIADAMREFFLLMCQNKI